VTGPVILPGRAEGAGGDEYSAALFALMRSVLTLAGLVDTLVRAEDWAARRRMVRVVDRYLLTVVAQVDVMRSWLDLKSQRRAPSSVYRSGRGGGS
jgi:hypothetical protein